MQKQPEVGVLVRRALTPEIRSVDEASKRITFTASDETVDRYGDVIRAKGWRLENYRKNPIVLWAHRSNELPVGKCVDCRVEDSPPALVQTVEFADHDFAKTVFNLYKGKFLNAVSVGFMPLEAPNRITDSESNTTGWEFTSQELLELSCVPVPANPQALARAVEKGFGTEADLARVFEAPSAGDVYKELIAINQEIASIAVALATKAVRQAHAVLKAAGTRLESSGDLTLEDLLDAVKRAGANVPKTEHSSGDIDSIEELGEALRVGDAEFERALGIGGEGDGGETSWNGSRKWRDPGRIARGG